MYPRYMTTRYTILAAILATHNCITMSPTPHRMMHVQGIEKMRASCKLAADVLAYAGTLVKVGSPSPTSMASMHIWLMLRSLSFHL